MDRFVTEKDILHKEHLAILSGIKSKLLQGYDLGLVLYNESWYAIDNNRSIIKELLKSLPIKPCDFDAKISNQDLLTIATFLDRNDHDSYWDVLCKDAGNHDNISIFYPKDARRFVKNIDIKGIPTRLHWLIRFLKELREIRPFHNRMYLALQLVKRKWVLSKIESMNLSPKIVMCFFDGNPDESLLMLYFKKCCAVTVTNQHGQPLFRSKEYDRMNQSQILAFKCDYFLAKGEFTRRQFEAAGFEGNRILPLGVAGNANRQKSLNDSSAGDKVIGVFLDSPILPFANESNLKLISLVQSISEKINCKFFIRMHPLDTADNYLHLIDQRLCLGIFDKSRSLEELFLICDVTIIHATATYLDSYRNGVRAFKYKTEIVFPISNKEDEFETEDELVTMIEGWFATIPEDKAKYIKKVFSEYDAGWYPGKTRDILQRLIK